MVNPSGNQPLRFSAPNNNSRGALPAGGDWGNPNGPTIKPRKIRGMKATWIRVLR